jgi:hypothetical protein
MKAFRLVFGTLFLFSIFFLFACSGGGSGSSDGTATAPLSMSLTDAKPALPVGVTNFNVTIEEVLVHKSGGKWRSLELTESPYTIDLLQFVNGDTTEFVPPVQLEVGKYTQVRMVISSASLIVLNEDQKSTTEYTVTIPSDKLKTDKNFDIDLDGHGVDITVDFDLSQSLVAEGKDGGPPYKLKPVLHIVETSADLILTGTIDNTRYTIEDPPEAIVTVSAFHAIEQTWTEYTKVIVPINTEDTTTDFNIYWLVPNENYLVEIDFNLSVDIDDYVEEIDPDIVDIEPGVIYSLNNGDPI